LDHGKLVADPVNARILEPFYADYNVLIDRYLYPSKDIG